jgi:hypothetical protein
LKILLDENLDWRLERHLPGYEVDSVPLIGWAGIENGELHNGLKLTSTSSLRWIAK